MELLELLYPLCIQKISPREVNLDAGYEMKGLFFKAKSDLFKSPCKCPSTGRYVTLNKWLMSKLA